jgi:hypothetical protein
MDANMQDDRTKRIVDRDTNREMAERAFQKNQDREERKRRQAGSVSRGTVAQRLLKRRAGLGVS